jgi:hypothetical protein
MSPSTIDRIATLAGALIVSSCRFGGPSGDPTLHVVDAAGGFAGTGGQAGRAGSGGSAGQGGGGGGGNPGGSAGAAADAANDVADDVIADGGRDGDAGLPDIQADDDVASDGNSADSAPPTACLPPFSSAVCDPVCNVGCPALFRCDVTDTPRTGVCIGTLLSSIGEGMACTRSPLTDDCVERLSCVEGICRRLCYRDTDCATSGTCCTTAIEVDAGPSGFRICGTCAP